MKGLANPSRPSQPRCPAGGRAGGASAEPHESQTFPLDLALPPVTETLPPWGGERQDRKVGVEGAVLSQG